MNRIAEALAAVLATDALLHLYWATGRTWPARDTTTLSRALLNADVPFTLPVLLPLVALLTTAATLVLAQGHVLPLPAPAALPRWATLAVAGGMLLRGLAGLVWATGLGTDRRSLFYRLNLALYTPLCLTCAAAAWYLAGH